MILDNMDEETLVELPAHKVFEELGYDTEWGPDLHPGKQKQERESFFDVLLKGRLREKLEDLNPDLPNDAYESAINQIEGLSGSSLIENNQKFHEMIIAGVKVLVSEKGIDFRIGARTHWKWLNVRAGASIHEKRNAQAFGFSFKHRQWLVNCGIYSHENSALGLPLFLDVRRYI